MCAGVMSVLLAACGSGGGDEDGDAGSASDAGSPQDAGAADAGGPVRITDSKIFPQRASSTTITFGLDADGPGSCLSEIVSGCEVQDCEAATDVVHVSAGTVTITTPLGDTAYAPDEAGVYAAQPGIDWEPGDEITLSVAGSADVAAFEVTVTGPGAVTAVTAPPMDQPALVHRGEPLTFEWEGADAAVAGVVSCTTVDGIQQVRCRFPSGVQGATMPADALARMRPCDNASVYVLTEERVLTGPPGLAVRFGPRGPIFTNNAVVD